MDENKNYENDKNNDGIQKQEMPSMENDLNKVHSEEKFSLGKEVFEWVQAIVVALVIALALRTFVFTIVNVQGASMEPTLQDGDRLVVTRLGYSPHQGDVIIFRPKMHHDTPYVKRVIATPGQEVNIDFNKHKIYVDGKEMDENFIKQPTSSRGDVRFPVKVPEGSVFVLGDNRNNSKDSRFSDVGMVENETIIGHAVYRIWPFNTFGNMQNK